MYLYTHVIVELRQRDEELKYTQEQSVTHKTTLQQQISERDTEIDKLRNQVSPPENLHVSSSVCVRTTELDYSWKRNTAVLLYNQLSDHGKRKWLAHMINPYYNPL